MKKIIITGASGFIGQHCLELLKQKDVQVFAISRKAKKDSNNIKWINLDLFNLSEVDNVIREIRPDALLHLAWETTPGIFYESDINYKWLEASLNLINTFIHNKGKKIVVAGSCAEYDWLNENMKESVKAFPKSLYGKCKVELYQKIKTQCEANNVDLSWGRVFNVFGPGENCNKIIPLLINSALLNKKMECMSREDKRDFIYVKDVANIFIKLLESKFVGICNIATGIGTSIEEITKLIEKKINASNIFKFKQNVSQFPSVVGSNQKLHELQYQMLFDLDQSLDETIKWWKNESINR